MLIRDYCDDDERFVFGTWLSTYKGAAPVRALHGELYYAYQRALIPALLARSSTVVADDDGLLLGWACAERVGPSTVAAHYVFVKPRDRQMGVAAAMFSALEDRLNVSSADTIATTHRAAPFATWLDRMGWKFAPRYLSVRNHEELAA